MADAEPLVRSTPTECPPCRKRPTDTPPSPATHPMQHGHRPASAEQVPATLVPEAGWHFLHLFYRVDRGGPGRALAEAARREGREADPRGPRPRPRRAPPSSSSASPSPATRPTSASMMAGPDLKAIHAVQIAVQASALGPALVPTYSFYSITEVSEYVPDVEEYGKILRDREGVDPESSVYKTKVAAYAERLGPMNQQRLYPEFPDWPCLCFYPMSKMRQGDQNWYLLPFEERSELMSQHGRSGMKFAGKVIAAHHRLDRPRRLGVGRHPLGPEPVVPQGHRLHDAVRRELGQVRPVRRLLFRLHPAPGRAARDDPDSDRPRLADPDEERPAMWTCPKCHAKVDPSFEVCWKCGTTPDGVEDPTFVRADDAGPIEDPPVTDEALAAAPVVAATTPPNPFGPDVELVEATSPRTGCRPSSSPTS